MLILMLNCMRRLLHSNDQTLQQTASYSLPTTEFDFVYQQMYCCYCIRFGSLPTNKICFVVYGQQQQQRPFNGL